MGSGSSYFQAASAGFSAGSAMSQGRWARSEEKSKENMARYNAELAERDAKIAEQESLFNQRLQALESEQIQGTLQAAMSASGARTDVGTLVLVREQQAEELEFGREIIAYEGAVKAQRFRAVKAGHLMQAEIFKQKGKQVWSAAKMSAVGSVLGGASQIYGGSSSTYQSPYKNSGNTNYSASGGGVTGASTYTTTTSFGSKRIFSSYGR